MGILLTYIVISLTLLTVFNQQINANNNLNNRFNVTSRANGGLGDFPVGPINFNMSGIEQRFNLILIPGQATTIYLTIGLLNHDYNIYPLVGFNYSYTANGVHDWIDFGQQSKIITASPPKTWTGSITLNVTYYDNRNNTGNATIPFIFTQGNNQNQNYVAFECANPLNRAINTFTVIFPLFTTINDNNKHSIKINNYGTLTDIGIFPWTSLQSVIKQSNVLNNINLNNQLYGEQMINISQQTNLQNATSYSPIIISSINSTQLQNTTSIQNSNQQQTTINSTTTTTNLTLDNQNVLSIPLPYQLTSSQLNQFVTPRPSTLSVTTIPTTQTVNTINGRTIIRLQNQVLISGRQEEVNNYMSHQSSI